MTWFYVGLYTLFLAIVWGFFIISKIHAFKFKNFSNNIKKVTYILFIFLIILSILGYVIIFLGDLSFKKYKLDFGSDNNTTNSSVEY